MQSAHSRKKASDFADVDFIDWWVMANSKCMLIFLDLGVSVMQYMIIQKGKKRWNVVYLQALVGPDLIVCRLGK